MYHREHQTSSHFLMILPLIAEPSQRGNGLLQGEHQWKRVAYITICRKTDTRLKRAIFGFVFLMCALNCCCTRATDRIIGTTLSLLFVIVLFLFSLLTLNESSFKWCETIGMGFSHFECNTSSSSLVLVLNKHSYWLNGDHYTQKREMVILNKL